MSNPLELIGVGEIARRTSKCDNTVRNKIRTLNIEPDAWNITGETRAPLFVMSRIPAILKQIEPQTVAKS